MIMVGKMKMRVNPRKAQFAHLCKVCLTMILIINQKQFRIIKGNKRAQFRVLIHNLVMMLIIVKLRKLNWK